MVLHLDKHLNPPTKTYETSANSEDAIAQTLACIREANLDGNLTTEVPATWATIHLAQVIKSQGLIANFELVADATSKHLLLHLNPKGNNSSTDKIADSQFDWLNQEFPKEILPLLQDLESEDLLFVLKLYCPWENSTVSEQNEFTESKPGQFN